MTEVPYFFANSIGLRRYEFAAPFNPLGLPGRIDLHGEFFLKSFIAAAVLKPAGFIFRVKRKYISLQ